MMFLVGVEIVDILRMCTASNTLDKGMLTG